MFESSKSRVVASFFATAGHVLAYVLRVLHLARSGGGFVNLHKEGRVLQLDQRCDVVESRWGGEGYLFYT